jgi:5-methylcytosine-specific restriction protein A
MTTTQRGYGTEWQRRRRAIIVRDRGICRFCGLPGATEVDHVVPKAHGGSDAPGNLAAAHKGCNSAAGGRTRRW